MAHSDVNRPTSRPLGHLAHYSIQPVSLPLESEPPQPEVAGEDFLYHLSRGSELLRENRIEAAKEALELALNFRPLDLRSQGLLGVVYFRLGLYPRAIEIYRQIVEALDEEISPKVNLALCYVKTGQHHAARELLEDVVRREPEHYRAWAYLGLVFQFQRDYAKAEAAFERARQPGMAERMRQLGAQLEPTTNPALGSATAAERWALQAAAGDALDELDEKSEPFRLDGSQESDRTVLGRWKANEPGEEVVTSADRLPTALIRASSASARPFSFEAPPLPEDLVQPSSSDASSAPTQLMTDTVTKVRDALAYRRAALRDWVARHRPRWDAHACWVAGDARTLAVELSEPFAVRADAVTMVSPAASAKGAIRLLNRDASNQVGEPLGGSRSPIVGFIGPGRLSARVTTGALEVIELADETLVVQSRLLFGLSLGLTYECLTLKLNRQQLEVVRLRGRGVAVLQLASTPMTLDVATDDAAQRDLIVRNNELVGWTANVIPEALDAAEAPGHSRDFLVLRGDGVAIVT
jgi:uncharacterized protein (AIM24 family)